MVDEASKICYMVHGIIILIYCVLTDLVPRGNHLGARENLTLAVNEHSRSHLNLCGILFIGRDLLSI